MNKQVLTHLGVNMKYVVASDIHGSLHFANKLMDCFKKEQANSLILLGDLYYHGPRNNLPVEYNPMEVANLLNNFDKELHVIKGNCDAEVDEMISNFKFNDHIELVINNKKFYFTHGHKHNKDNIPNDIDYLVYGHFHTGFIEKVQNTICINSGSTSLPKNNTLNSYLVITNEYVELKDLEGNLIDSIKL